MIQAIKDTTYHYVDRDHVYINGEKKEGGIAWNDGVGNVYILQEAFTTYANTYQAELDQLIMHEAQHSITPDYDHGVDYGVPKMDIFEGYFADDLQAYRNNIQ